VGASITFKARARSARGAAVDLRAERVPCAPQVITGVAFFAYAYLTRDKFGAHPRAQHAALASAHAPSATHAHRPTPPCCRRAGPAAERSLVLHSVLTFPNYVVIGVPVLSAVFTPALVKQFMSLLLMEQVSLHLTYVAVAAEMFCAKAPAPVVGEHAHGALHLHGPPLRTDAHGWATHIVAHILTRTGGHPPGVGGGAAEGPVALSGRSASQTTALELKPRPAARASVAEATEHAAPLLAGGDAAPAEHTHGEADAEAGHTGCVPSHVMPEHANAALRALRIMRDRLLHNPMVMGALAVRPRRRARSAPRVALTRVHTVRASSSGRHHDACSQGHGPQAQAALCAAARACTRWQHATQLRRAPPADPGCHVTVSQ
jgi:hypothetical protein